MHLEDKELIDELLRQIDICEHQVNAYSNKRDKDSKNMWYYWYGRRGSLMIRSWVYPESDRGSRAPVKLLFV